MSITDHGDLPDVPEAAGGGTAILCTEATVLHEFLPASEIFATAASIVAQLRTTSPE